MALLLIVDDIPAICHTIRRILEADGHEVLEAEDGEVGIRVLLEREPALVIIDLFMPNREGLETIREIRRLAMSTKIIAMSGGAKLPTLYLNAADAMGADATLSKPFRTAELRGIVQRLLAPAVPRIDRLRATG